MTRWQDGAFIAAVKQAWSMGLSHRTIATKLGTSERQVWQALHGCSLERTEPARRACLWCGELLDADAPMQQRRHPACAVIVRRQQQAASHRRRVRGVTVRAYEVGDLAPAAIDALLEATLREVRAQHRFTLNAWQQKAPQDWDV